MTSSISPSSGVRLLFVVNDPQFFLSHRINIALAARDRGYDVFVAAPAESKSFAEIEAAGFHPVPIYLSRWGARIHDELRAIKGLVALYRELKPELVHHVTIKPVIYGTIAARIVGVPGVVNAVPGLGHVFSSTGLIAQTRRLLVKCLYRAALRHPNQRVIFQNPDDQQLFIEARLVADKDVVLVKGSGVDTSQFYLSPQEPGIPKVVFSGRLLWNKGVREFVEAARQIQQRGISAQFFLAGTAVADNPGGVPLHQIEKWRSEGVVQLLGHCKDMAKLLRESHIVCLPSFYGEGVPKALIEAAASGRTIVTTDSAGCRSIVSHGVNGFLTPPRDVDAIVQALVTLLSNPPLRVQMGAAGRAKVINEGFSEEAIVRQIMTVYEELLMSGADPTLEHVRGKAA